MNRILGLLMLALAVPFAVAQNAEVTGVVTDKTSAVVPGTAVTLNNLLTGVASTTKTNNDGLFTFEVQPGTYTAKAEHAGFKVSEVSAIGLHVADRITVNFRLEVGGTNQVVTVRGDDLSLNTTDGAVSTVIDRQLIENMPLNGRSLDTLFELTPGVVLNAGGMP